MGAVCGTIAPEQKAALMDSAYAVGTLVNQNESMTYINSMDISSSGVPSSACYCDSAGVYENPISAATIDTNENIAYKALEEMTINIESQSNRPITQQTSRC